MKQKKILWIEDDAHILKNLFYFLIKDGFSYDNIRTYKEFTDLKKDDFDKYCTVFVDIMIPSGDIKINEESGLGIDIIFNIRHELKSNIPIVVLTGFSSMIQELDNLDAYDPIATIQKSILPSELHQQIISMLK
jgi:DNA-binding response OmpR family regulator